MSDFTVQEVLPRYPLELFPNTQTESGSLRDTEEALLPWLTPDGEPVFVQMIEDEDAFDPRTI